jgi:hypothetical protein
VMRRSLLLAFVSTFAVASVALAATGGKAEPRATLVEAVSQTNHASSVHYVMQIAVAHTHHPSLKLNVNGARGTGSLFIHVRAFTSLVNDGPADAAGPQQSAFIDGPFLYEGSPNGVAVAGKIRWLRVPLERAGTARAISAMHNMSPAPLLRILDEWSNVRSHTSNGVFHGTVAYDDPIVLTALSGMTGGTEFRHVFFSVKIGDDGYVHTIRITGTTADKSKTVAVTAHPFGFGRPLRVAPPREGTFIDQKLPSLAA